MSCIKVSLPEDFYSIVQRKDFDRFTVSELRSAYIALSENISVDKNEAQRLVYRQILKLKDKGLLKRIDSKSTKKTTYVKTELFYRAIFNIVKNKDENECDTVTSNPKVPCSKEVVKNLTDKIQNYKTELLSSMGESGEYKDLYTTFPHLKGPLQESYNNARNNNSKLIGRIIAIENLIKLQQESRQPNEAS
jgi:hypothetical protein